VSGEEEGGFLGRWSRLKRAEVRPAPAEAPPPEPETQSGPEAEAEPATLSEEELAALPRIEDLVQGSDIRPFLRAGVPRVLRNAALRRIWMLTPAIRDYRDPAVDYAWDWNTPGGVPGDGAAPSAERAAEMLRDLFAPRERPPERPVEEAPAAEEAEPILAQDTEAGSREEGEADGTAAGGAEPEPLPRRRHGSALPS
jgi:hypothetical protein